ncbi:MAG: AAA family ATPase [Polyangiaceae bacterium]
MTAPDPARLASACTRFKVFFDELSLAFVERSDVLTQIALGLLAREHILLAGPPGTAKSQIAAAVLGRIVNEETGAPSLYARQITESTVQTDLIGPIDFRNLMDTGRTTHFTDEGILGSVHAFLDEVFDGRDMLLRSALNVLQERELKQGGSIAKGKIECAIMTTNRYISEILEQSRETLLAFVDRIAFIGFVPRGFADPALLGRVLKRSVGGLTPPKLDALLTVQDLDVLQAAVDDVYVAPEICDLLATFLGDLDRELSAAVRADPAFGRTRYFSTRTAVRSGRILRAATLYDRIFLDPSRSLEVESKHLRALRLHLVLTGPSPEEAKVLLERETDPNERRQLSILRTEREIFDACVSKVGLVERTPRPTAPSPDTNPAARSTAAADPLAPIATKLDARIALGDVKGIMSVAREIAPLMQEGAPRADAARALFERATQGTASIAFAAGLGAPDGENADAQRSLLTPIEGLVDLAQNLEDGTVSMHGVATWVAARAFARIDDAAMFAASASGSLLDELAGEQADPRDKLDAHLALIERLAVLRRGLRAHSAAQGVVVDDGRFAAAVERAEALVGAWWSNAFGAALANAKLLTATSSGVEQMLRALEPELGRLSALDARLSALSTRKTSVKERVVGPRLKELVREALLAGAFVDRVKFVGQVKELAAILARSGLGGAIPVDAWLAWTGDALLAAEGAHERARREQPRVETYDADSYYDARKHELRSSLTCVLAEVALHLERSTDVQATLADAFKALPDGRRTVIVEADATRIERALTFLERWFDSLEDADLRAVAASRIYRVVWDEGALARFAIEAKLVVDTIPEAEERIGRVRTRVELLGKRAEQRALALLGRRADQVWAALSSD